MVPFISPCPTLTPSKLPPLPHNSTLKRHLVNVQKYIYRFEDGEISRVEFFGMKEKIRSEAQEFRWDETEERCYHLLFVHCMKFNLLLA